MRLMKHIVTIPAAIAACGIAAGCFSYHKTVDETPAPVVENVPAPVVTVPTTSATTTTTTTDNGGMVERQKTTTYTSP
jgi:hypothetical protein